MESRTGIRAAGRDVRAAPYARVKQYLKKELARGRWTPGALMPSEADLVERFRVSRMTVNRAMKELQNEGLVDRIKGSGTFAAPLHRVSSTLTIRDLHDEIGARGNRHRVFVHHASDERANRVVAGLIGLDEGSRVFHTQMVHYENDRPVQFEDRYVNPERAPDYLSVDFSRTTPTHYLLEVAPMWEAQYAIVACLPSALEARLLDITMADPCLQVQRRTVSRDQPITYVRLVHPGDRYQIAGQFKP